MVHIGRPHTSLPYRGGGGGSAELPAIGNTALLGTDNTGTYGAYPLAATIVSLLAADTTGEARAAIEAVSTTQVQTLIDAAVDAIVDGAPTALDTLRELATELEDQDGAVAALTTVVDGKQPLHATLTALSALALAANQLIYVDGSGNLAVAPLTSAGRSLLDDADVAAMRQTLALRPGTEVQTYNADLTTLAAGLAGLSDSVARIPAFIGNVDTWIDIPTQSFGRSLLGQANAAGLNNALTMAINPQTGTSYDLVLSDAQKLITMNNANPNTIRIPTNAVAFPVGTVVGGLQLGAGQTSFVAITPGTTTIRSAPGPKIANQYGSAAAVKIAAEEWVAYGALAA